MNTLHVYALMQHPLRSTASDHLYSFRRYGTGRNLYLNLSVRDVPEWTRTAPLAAVVFHTTFFSHRWAASQFRDLMERAAPLKRASGVKVALPQDEFLQTNLLNEFMNEFEIDHIFTLAPESEWPKIYEHVDRDRVGFRRVLPGYLSDHTAKRIERILGRKDDRPVDIGYRAWQGAPWLGSHGMLKREVGDRVAAAAGGRRLRTDISTSDTDVLNGDAWFEFLASCKYTVGVEGGAGMQHRDGTLIELADAYLAEHPNAGYEEVAAACFPPGADGELDYFAIGPRHIEACATRTCQVLLEGDYQGVLRPGDHYIPLKRDFSNLEEVLDLVERDELRAGLTETAYRDVIASGRFSYRALVSAVEEVTARPSSVLGSLAFAPRAAWERALDTVSWWRVVWTLRGRPRWIEARTRARARMAPIAPYLPHRLVPNAWRRLARAFQSGRSGPRG